METGMGARDQPLMMVISTAGSNLAGPCHEMQRDVERVLEGLVDDDALFGIIFTADNADEWDSEEALIKANPDLDISVSGEFLRQQRDQARRSAGKQNHFRTKHLNQWVGARTVWMNMLAWQRQHLRDKERIEAFKRSPCHVAVDLASRKDVAVALLEWKNGGEFYTEQRFYIPESALEDNETYQRFNDIMVVTPGNMTDQAYIEEDLKTFCKDFDVRSMAFDDWQADYMMTRLLECGLPVVNYNQTVRNMSTPMKEVEGSVLNRVLWHDGNPVMTWMMGNVTAKLDAKENIYPRKENDNDPKCKIDGPVALIMAHGRWLAEESGGTLNEFLNSVIRL
jgi:phage terminase large subunit-like protein